MVKSPPTMKNIVPPVAPALPIAKSSTLTPDPWHGDEDPGPPPGFPPPPVVIVPDGPPPAPPQLQQPRRLQP